MLLNLDIRVNVTIAIGSAVVVRGLLQWGFPVMGETNFNDLNTIK